MKYWPLRYVVRRGAVLYILLRIIVVAFLSGATKETATPLLLRLGILIVLGTLHYVDPDRRNERVLWSNLGYQRRLLLLAFMAPAVLGEGLLEILAS